MGIGGIGMSGIAKVLRKQGYRISGCDNMLDAATIKELVDLGCVIAPCHNHSICTDLSIDVLVRSSAVPLTHQEIIAAQIRKIPVILRATILAEIMRSKFSIAVAGSHGKTTTSSLLAHVLMKAHYNPTVIIGGIMSEINTNALFGNGQLLVAEADESDRSFLFLPKAYSIITNINLEHVDTYHDFEDLKNTFIQFLNTIPFYGLNVICTDSPGIQEVIPKITTSFITYGTKKNATMQAINIDLLPSSSSFELINNTDGTSLGEFTISLPGIHNVLNAVGVITLATHLGAPIETIKLALASFGGVDRRFTFRGLSNHHGALIFDDYGHHPTEILHTLEVAHKKAMKNLIVVFQPHRFTRTRHFWSEFVNLFASSKIDLLIITDIFPASEAPIIGISSELLVADIKQKNPSLNVIYYEFGTNGEAIQRHLESMLQAEDLVLLQGAGKANKIAKALIS